MESELIIVLVIYTYMVYLQGGHSPVMIKFPDFSKHFEGTYHPSQQLRYDVYWQRF